MSYSAQLLRAAVTYVALEADLRLEDLSVDERAQLLDAAAAISLLAVLADADVMAPMFRASELSVSERIGVLEVVAELGEFFRRLALGDSFSSTDDTTLSIGKFVYDEVTGEDDVVISQEPGIGDQWSASDQLLASVIKRLADEVSLIESTSLKNMSSTAGAFAEGLTLVELAAMLASKVMSDTAAASDAAALTAAKDFYESVSSADEALLTWSCILESADTASVGDEFSLQVEPAASDSVSFADAIFAMSAAKAIAETVTAAELAALIFTMPESDSASVSDASAAMVTKRPSEQVSTAEVGTVALSDYAIDYFDEDYVLTDVRSF